ncbi:endo-1,4-beta-xylanase [Parvularcula marina]|uniref:endo-1,4-beta-xylanase n=1 Tax=Parvularcula marina TaxID=2292771 RepID=UPI003514756A
MTDISRREALGMGAAALAAGTAASGTVLAEKGPSLSALAKAKGLRFGTAIAAYQLDDPKYLDLVRRECGALVAENEHKMYVIEREKGAYNFAPADALVAFAKTNDLMMRGHTLVWHHPNWLPQWVNETQFASAADAEAVLGGYIGKVAGRYDPFLYSWDVVNETIDPATGGLRETSFSRAMGPEVIDFCFHQAREHAPDAKLAYNDYMSWEDGHELHRTGVLKLLEDLLSRGAPIDALGIQSHSNDDMPTEFTPAKQKAWREFCDEVTAMGLDIYMTEFDVNDTEMGPDIETRDREMASFTKDYLDIMFSYPETKELLVWGLVDKYSWLQNFKPRTDDVEKRPTPFDSNYQPKPMRDAIGEALKAAPGRTLG